MRYTPNCESHVVVYVGLMAQIVRLFDVINVEVARTTLLSTTGTTLLWSRKDYFIITSHFVTLGLVASSTTLWVKRYIALGSRYTDLLHALRTTPAKLCMSP